MIKCKFVSIKMQVASSHIIPLDSKFIATAVKKNILIADDTATVILFGSRARGDAENDSDWDFLVLTQKTDIDSLSDSLRKIMLQEVELKYDVAISLIVKNEETWKNHYVFTNIFESLTEEGIQL